MTIFLRWLKTQAASEIFQEVSSPSRAPGIYQPMKKPVVGIHVFFIHASPYMGPQIFFGGNLLEKLDYTCRVLLCCFIIYKAPT